MERNGIWIPLTPAKQIPARSDNDCKAASTSGQGPGKEDINEAFVCLDSFNTKEYFERNGVNMINELADCVVDEHEVALGEAAKDPASIARAQYDTKCVQGDADKVPPSGCDGKNAHCVHESEVGVGSVPSPSETKGSRKRHNDGVGMNKTPNKRPRMKKHRPKVFDDSKPKKVPKTQTPRASTPRPKTPKPATPEQVQDRRNYSRKNFTGSTTCFQSSTSHGLEEAIQDVQVASSTSISDVKSCKRSLNFNYNLVDGDTYLTSKSHEESLSFNFDLGRLIDYSQVVTSKRNTTRKSRFPKKSLITSEYLLGDKNMQECRQDMSVVKNQEGAEKHVRKYIYFYQRRKKNNSNTTSCIPELQVYQRKFKENQCLQNSKKIGPNFPRMFKKPRVNRKKASVNVWWSIKALEDGKKNVKRSNRILIQTTRKRVYNSVNKSKDKKGFNLSLEKWLINVISPKRRKRSIWHTRRRENIMDYPISKAIPYGDAKRHTQLEDNYLQIMECLPLQEVPFYGIESSTSPHQDVQRVDDSVGNLKWRQLQEVQVLGSQDRPLTKQDCNKLYVKEMIEYVMKKLVNLDISGQCKKLVVRDRKISGALTKIDPPKKRKVSAKVELDEETLRVWKLLMENDGSESVKETDKDKEEWWERQRNIFRGRVDSFIAKMHQIQGNRRFSPWKGSVVDSVVGVFLTQNVTDHLSSSVFLNLASRFPVKTRSNEVREHGDVASSQESVKSNIKVDGCFSKNDELEQDMSTPCANEHDVTPTVELEEEVASNPLLVQDKPCIDEISYTSRKHVDIEEMDSLKKFSNYSNDESPLNESRVDGDLSTSIGESKEQIVTSFDFSSSHEPCATITDVKMGLYETSVNRNEENELLHEANGGDEDEHMRYLENELILQQKATPEDPKIAALGCSLHSEVTIERGAIAISNGLKEMPLDTISTGNKKSKMNEKKEMKTDWEKLRKTYCKSEGKETNENNTDAVDWDAVRRAPVKEIAETIVERGMNNVLAARIKNFLERMVADHGTIDLEWLRDVPPDKAKEFLLSISGLGLKSVECVRLLTLHHLAFPVDTNVGRVATRLGWVPLQPLPEEVQIHLLNAYPDVDIIQKYLFPRLCTLDQRTLYELHYQLITFGKVFCTKLNPNCNACPMRAECRHYASAFASARLALPGSKERSSINSIIPAANDQNHSLSVVTPLISELRLDNFGSNSYVQNCQPIIEIPPSPEPEVEETLPCDIEDYFCESDDEIPTIRLSSEDFKETLKDAMDVNNISMPEADMSKAIVALTSEAAYKRASPMKFVAKLRTVHYVYELPDFHPSLAGFDEREHDDPTPYLLVIWVPGERSKSTENEAGDSSNNNEEETVKGTVLIPCRTATRGRFPLNGTYFQVNEVFADDETSRIPMDVPRRQLWNLQRRWLGCGTSATSIFKGMSTADIQHFFWRGSVCVRGFNRKTRKPRPIHPRLHISTTAVAAGTKKAAKRKA